ncbi:ABC transporter substrate-binding protein [Clostridium beijerinckii]|jgi:ABC-type nitrate/sulfonate/bicarbonate transport systems, periplasmic components|uniref:ABC transporter substrate-binding protein n=2 Tax=Clostridium beijerinckii TaxID=1520 RepID=A0A0B5QKR6_CLOBE|nr:ABC transporter substrate-binding protein [Clostridium beijerinckii]ABR32803.1 ABC-type nitrate/sulfonate/bicarbonate transport systems periplasmic components-like protein [Clostridium beijerinckii NCIMB 8052]AIU01287.1 ABC-type nitrate/sulfonate/bicarbonate transport systems periplasmic components-like protein [Clostridium beijerinckii ATCC 35702]AJG97318.1 nitrate ABC transporter substrate-binding protein [Clostridium beijerinckii]MBF7807518.1 ABC transporter substrate-binding protein [Clo
MAIEKEKKVKRVIQAVIAVLVIGGIIIGAQLGKTKYSSPSESLEANSSAKSDDSTSTSSDDLFPIKTATRKDCTLAPFLVADKKGFFKEEGLKLVFTGELSSDAVTPAILSGDNDVADTHPNALALKVYGGSKIKAVGRSIIEPGPGVDPKLRHMRFYVNKDAVAAGVKTWNDLTNYKGNEKLKSAGYTNTCEDFIPNKISDAKGVSRDKFEWITFETDLQKIEALKLGQVDIIGVHPPFFDAAQEAGLTQIADSSEAGLGEATGVYLYYFSDSFIEKHPDKVAAFVKAMTKAQKWANANVEETAKLTSEFIGTEVKGNHYYSETTKIDEQTINPWIEDLENTGAIPKGAIKVDDIITHKFEAQ